jgi:hypothetical protein
MSESDPNHFSVLKLLRNARGPYLGFLRNLTPQALLSAIVIYEQVHINFARLDISNTLNTLTFFMLVVALVYSIYANCTMFLADIFPSLLAVPNESYAASRAAGHSRLSAASALILSLRKRNHLEIGSFLICLSFVFLSMLVVLIAAISSTVTILRAIGQ